MQPAFEAAIIRRQSPLGAHDAAGPARDGAGNGGEKVGEKERAKMNAEWAIGRKMFLRKYRMQAGLCALCALPFAPEVLTRDHIIPRSKGGGTQWDNIQLACAPCNEQKGNTIK